MGVEMVSDLWRYAVRAVMLNITNKQDVMGRPGRKVLDLRPAARAAKGGLDYDYLYVGGKKLTPPLKTTNFLKVYLDGTTTPEWVAAMPETQDSDAEVFDVRKNRIHLPGNFGGG